MTLTLRSRLVSQPLIALIVLTVGGLACSENETDSWPIIRLKIRQFSTQGQYELVPTVTFACMLFIDENGDGVPESSFLPSVGDPIPTVTCSSASEGNVRCDIEEDLVVELSCRSAESASLCTIVTYKGTVLAKHLVGYHATLLPKECKTDFSTVTFH